MKYLSLFSGIEAASVAWHPLGWEPVGFAEIEKFPSAVLQHHFPNIKNFHDVTKYKDWPADLDFRLLVGGSPCVSFSVAGLRKGLDDPRGNLMLTYLAIAKRYRPRWVVWENVPGVLSSNGGKDFATFLNGLAECGYGLAYRVLDAQFVRVDGYARAVPQRRRRVFVVGCLGNWQAAAAVLFERESLSGHPKPSRKKGESIAPTVVAGPPFSRTGNERVEAEAVVIDRVAITGMSSNEVSQTLNKREYKGVSCGRDGLTSPLVVEPVTYPETQIGSKECRSNPKPGDPAGTLTKSERQIVVFPEDYQEPIDSAKAFQQNTRDEVRLIGGDGEIAGALASNLGAKQQNYLVEPTFAIQGNIVDRSLTAGASGKGYKEDETYTLNTVDRQAVCHQNRVRRLTPLECERLQGFPDNWTQIPWKGKPAEACPDGPRYAACGNSMAVNVMRWIGTRIDVVDKILNEN